jgi:hypothetical protein
VNEFISKYEEPLPPMISKDNCCVRSESYTPRGEPAGCGPNIFSETFRKNEGSNTGGSFTSMRFIVIFAKADKPNKFTAFTTITYLFLDSKFNVLSVLAKPVQHVTGLFK